MKLLKPEWVHHDQKLIYSIDVHPDGTKFATGGQGNECGRVVVWNLEPVLSSDAEEDKSISKVLCQMDNHLACVNCVRWSANGLMLASAGDDKIVMLWKRAKGPTAVFGNGGITKTTENWRCVQTLRGHNEDIYDLAWSPQDRWLASCSVDNNIIVWDMNNLPSMVTVLKGHTGLVKGVTWDPVGRYLASQSSDQSVKIWRTSDWACEATITEPFKDCSDTTSVLRLSWSPDGQYLVSAHAMNGGGPTAQIVERDGWKCDKDFVGHRKAVSCVRFHPSILKRQAADKNKTMQCCCLAIGSRDKSLSVWTTAMNRPLLVIYDLFEDSVLDLSWSSDRHILLACSKDGTVACIMFSDEELGTSISKEDKNALYQRMYGKGANIDLNDSQTERGLLIEYAELMTSMSDTHFNNNNTVNNNNINSNSNNHIDSSPNIEMKSISMPATVNDALPTQVAITPTKAIHKQIETRTAEGKRRITPMFIPLQDDVNETPADQCAINSSSRQTSSVVVEMQMNDQMSKGQAKMSSPTKSLDTFRSVSSVDLEINKITSIESNGFQLDSRLTKVAPVKTALIPTNSSCSNATPTESTSATANIPIRLTVSSAGKALPYKTRTEKINGNNKVEILNGNVSTAYGPLTKVTCVTTKAKSWELLIGSPIVNFCMCAKYVLVCCLDGTIQFIDIKTGVAVLPKLKMLSPAVQCVFSINGELGGIVTECGLIRIWNLTLKEIFLSTNCYDLLSTADGSRSYVMYFYVSESGVVFILLSNGCSFSYCKKLDSWITLNSRDPIIRNGISSQPHNSSKCIKSFPLGSVQSASHTFQPASRNFTDLTNGAWRNTAKLQFIEDEIKICEAINSPAELEHWYSLLGLHLAQYGTETRIRILFDDLLGVAFTHSLEALQSNRTTDTILGIEKHKILSKVLEHFKCVPKWQRIYMEYLDQLNVINAQSNGPTNDVGKDCYMYSNCSLIKNSDDSPYVPLV